MADDKWDSFTVHVDADRIGFDNGYHTCISEQKDGMISTSHQSHQAPSLKLQLPDEKPKISPCPIHPENITPDQQGKDNAQITKHSIKLADEEAYITDHSNTHGQTLECVTAAQAFPSTTNICSDILDMAANGPDLADGGCDVGVNSAVMKHPRSVCPICGKTFSYVCSLKSHLRIHSGERPFICEECGRSFTQSGALHMHLRIHHGVRPHQCTLCEKTFVQRSDLTGHMRSHTGEKSFECFSCKKCFRLNSHLHRHVARQHSKVIKYQCSVCGKGFTTNDNLKQHQQTHLDSKPFSCSTCERRFNFKLDLRRHILIHSGTKPFECTQCGKVFNRSSNLNRHILTIHKTQL